MINQDKHNQKIGEEGPQRGARNTSSKGKGPVNGRSFVKKTGPWPPQKNIQKNRYKLNHNNNNYLCMNHSNSLPVCNENSCNKITCDDNQDLVILSKQTLTQTQDVLRKGLSFIPKPKKLNIHQQHNDLRLFMHRMKCKL